MGNGKEIVTAIEKAYRQKSFDSKDSIVRVGNSGTYLLEWRGAEGSVQAEFVEQDSIGLLLNSLIVGKDVREEKDTATYLKTVAEAIEKRVNYLMEPLRVVELDSTTNAVQMRSEKPEVLEGNLFYFELILKSGKWFGHRQHLSLHRYSHRPDQEKNRRAVAFPLTKQQFERLLDDLIDVL